MRDISDEARLDPHCWKCQQLWFGEDNFATIYFGCPELGGITNGHPKPDWSKLYNLEQVKIDDKTTRLVVWFLGTNEEYNHRKEYQENKDRLDHLVQR